MNASEKQQRLEARYRAALNYDKSWVEPPNGFGAWRIGTPRAAGQPPRTGTIFDRLVKLGVLRKTTGLLPVKDELEDAP